MAQTYEIHAWLADKVTGFLIGEIHSYGSTDDFTAYAANAAKNGQTAVDQTAPGAVKPPAHP